jgi:hypothetical protein
MIDRTAFCFCACLLVVLLPGETCADAYVRDRAPTYTQGSAHIPVRYTAPRDRTVCDVYLQNLQYFAQQDLPMSCDRPVAPSLADRIAKVPWEDVDPDKYSELFQALVAKETFSPPKPPKPEDVAWHRGLLKDKALVFQRATTLLVGHPRLENEYEDSGERKFWLVRYGSNTDLNRRLASPCSPERGGSQQADFPLIYLVSEDLRQLFGHLASVADGEGPRTFLMIHGRPYIEEIFRNGDIRLSELPERPVILEPVCLYHYKRSQ